MANGSSTAQEIRVVTSKSLHHIQIKSEMAPSFYSISNFYFMANNKLFCKGRVLFRSHKSTFCFFVFCFFLLCILFYFLNQGCDSSKNDLRLFMSFCWANSCTIKAWQQQVFDEPWKCCYLAPSFFLSLSFYVYNTFVTKISSSLEFFCAPAAVSLSVILRIE